MTPADYTAVIALYVAGYFGMFCHFLVKALKGELPDQYARSKWRRFVCKLARYTFVDHPGYTLSAVITTFAACTAVITLGQIDGTALYKVAAFGWMAGYTIDSAINRTAN
jgi:hypothetical protein